LACIAFIITEITAALLLSADPLSLRQLRPKLGISRSTPAPKWITRLAELFATLILSFINDS
jgi:hypothetical protein